MIGTHDDVERRIVGEEGHANLAHMGDGEAVIRGKLLEKVLADAGNAHPFAHCEYDLLYGPRQ